MSIEKIINDAWEIKDQINQNSDKEIKDAINQVISDLSESWFTLSLFSQASLIIFSIDITYLLFNNLISFRNKDRFSIL